MGRYLRGCMDVLRDPGFGFAVCNVIYASMANSVALAGAFICAVAIIGLRALRVALPADGSGLRRHLHDEAVSLRLLAAVIMLSSLYTMAGLMMGHYSADTISLVALQATAGILFATGNFMLAASFGRVPATAFSIAATLRQPETWMAAGMLCLGLMAGAAALIIFPFVAIGYVIALQNIRHARPEYHRHPKLWYAAGTLGFAGIASDPLLVLANLINAVCLVVIEHRLTPGGLLPQPTERETA